MYNLCRSWISDSKNKKVDISKNNSENSSATKIGEHIPCGYSVSTIWAFGSIRNKHSLYRGENSRKKFCISLREHAAGVISFEKKKMLPLTEKELKLHQYATQCYICRKKLMKKKKKIAKDKHHWKVRDDCHFRGKCIDKPHSICNLRFHVLHKILVVLHNGSNYDYHFTMKDLVNEFKAIFEFLGRSTKKYKTFSVPIEKEI